MPSRSDEHASVVRTGSTGAGDEVSPNVHDEVPASPDLTGLRGSSLQVKFKDLVNLSSASRINKLQRHNWVSWQFEFKMRLKRENLYNAVFAPESIENDAVRDYMVDKACTSLVDSVHIDLHHIIRKYETAADMYKALKKSFETTAKTRIIDLEAKFGNLKLEKRETVAQLYARLRDIVDSLETAGVVKDEETVKLRLISAMPKVYYAVTRDLSHRMVFDNVHSVDDVLAELIDAESGMGLAPGASRGPEQALHADGGDTNGKPEGGAKKGNNKSRGKNSKDKSKGDKSAKPFQCFVCGEAGHMARECPNRHKGNGGGGGKASGSGTEGFYGAAMLATSPDSKRLTFGYKFLPDFMATRHNALYSSGLNTRVKYNHQDFMLERKLYRELRDELRGFDVDGAADYWGYNAQLPNYCSALGRSFFDMDIRGLRVYCNPPFDMTEAFLNHVLDAHAKDPTTSAAFVLQFKPNAPWWHKIKHWKVLRHWPAGTQLFTLPSPSPEFPGERYVRDPCHFDVVVMYLPPSESACFAAASEFMLLDSGASNHMTPHRHLLHDYRAMAPGEREGISIGDKSKMPVCGIGTIVGDTLIDGKKFRASFGETLHVPGLAHTLLSVGMMTGRNATVRAEGDEMVVIKEGAERVMVTKKNNLYALRDFEPVPPGELAGHVGTGTALPAQLIDKEEQWHRRLGHLSRSGMRRLLDMSEGIPLSKAEIAAKERAGVPCGDCMAGRQSRDSRPLSTKPKATAPMERLHVDLMGPMSEESLDGTFYSLTVIDEATGFSWVRPLEGKTGAETAQELLDIIKATELKTGHKLKAIRSDRGGEFVNQQLGEELRKRGAKHELTAGYSPESNGMAERTNRTLVERARSMLHWAKCPRSFWAEALEVACYLRNLAPTAGRPATPYEMLFGVRPDLSRLHTFGCMAYVHVDKDLRSKLDFKCLQGVFLRVDLESKQSRVFVDGKVVVSRDVVCDDTKPAWPELHGEVEFSGGGGVPVPSGYSDESGGGCGGDDSGDVSGGRVGLEADPRGFDGHLDTFSTHETDVPECVNPELQSPLRESTGHYSDVDSDDEQEGSPERRFPLRERKQVVPFSPSALSGIAADIPEPGSYKQAIGGPHGELWRDAAIEQIEALQSTGTWELTVPPDGAKVIPCKWVFKVKSNSDGSVDRFKARLVAGGHRQVEGIDYTEVFAPVGRYQSLRTILAATAHYDLEAHCIDISNAFLNGVLKEEVYMRQPEGFHVGAPNVCCKLKKTLYGLKQAPKEWFEVLSEGLRSAGFTQSDSDRALWFQEETQGRPRVIILHWVDDLIIVSKSIAVVQEVKKKILTKFKGRDLGDATAYLNMKIERDRAAGTLKISQPSHIDALLKKFDMDEAKPKVIPMSTGADYSTAKDGEELLDEGNRFAECVGGLLYIAAVTRPDLATAVSVLARSMAKPTKRHWLQLKQLLRYLVATRTLGIIFGGGKDGLEGWTDSDYAACKDTRRSRGGFVFNVFGGAVSWQSKLQSVVATSTAESEYIAGSFAAREAKWLRRICNDVGIPTLEAVPLKADNQAAIHMAVNSSDSTRTKHIDVHYHVLRELVTKQVISLKYINTDDNPADIFTKPLGDLKFRKFRGMLGMG